MMPLHVKILATQLCMAAFVLQGCSHQKKQSLRQNNIAPTHPSPGQDPKNENDPNQEQESPQGNSPGNETTEKVLRLKNANQLKLSLFRTLGAGKDLDRQGENIIDKYAEAFGTTTNLRIGDQYSDRLSSGYLMSLSVVAQNATERCDSDGQDPLCQCSTTEDASAMMMRALPSMAPSDLRFQNAAEELARACRQGDAIGITSLVASIAFAAKI